MILSPLFGKVNYSLANNSETNLLVVFLRGGADGLNILVPYKDEYYYELRPDVAIQEKNYIPINSDFAINKNFKDSFLNWYKQDNLVFIPASGQRNNSRSHFLAQDIMEYGVSSNGLGDSGFLARLMEILQNNKAISYTGDLSPICRSDKIVIPNINMDLFTGSNKKNEEYNNTYNDEIKSFYNKLIESNKEINAIKTPYETKDTKLSKVAYVMKNTNYNVGFVDFENWDTHSQEGGENGRFNQLTQNLNKELNDFKEGMGSKWKNTLVVIVSEFGRTVKQNANGTEHGHGNLMTLTGGLISKSKVAGDWLSLKKENLHEARDIPVLYEYRDVLGEVFTKMYGLNNEQLNYVFPSCKKTSLNLI